MAGNVLSISFSPFHGDISDLWSSTTSLLTEDFSLDLSGAEIAELVHSDDDGWSLGASYQDLGLPVDEFLRLSQGAVIRGALRSLGLPLHSEISFFRDPPTLSGEPCLCLSFGTLLHRQLYPDVTEPHAEDHPKRALLQLCFALAEAIGTSAFIIEDNNDRLLRPVDLKEFAQFLLSRPTRTAQATDMTSRLALLDERIGYYQGIAPRYLKRSELAEAWHASGGKVGESIHGYVTVDLL